MRFLYRLVAVVVELDDEARGLSGGGCVRVHRAVRQPCFKVQFLLLLYIYIYIYIYPVGFVVAAACEYMVQSGSPAAKVDPLST